MTIVVNKVYTIILTINANIIGCNTFTTTNIHCCIRIDKPLNLRIIIPALQVVHSDFFVEIITSVAERVDICNVDAVGRLCAGDNAGVGTPSIIAISADDTTVLVGDCNDVSLQILQEVVGHIVVDDTADRILVIIQRNQNILISLCLLIIVPALTQDLGAIQEVIMLDTCDRLAGTDAVGVISVGNCGFVGLNEPLQLAALLPSQSMAQIRGRVALSIVGDSSVVGTVLVYSNFALLSN